MNIPLTIIRDLEQQQIVIVRAERVSGGDINEAAKLYTKSGQTLFLKYNLEQGAQAILKSELLGLQVLKEKGLPVPQLYTHSIDVHYPYLLMEWVEPDKAQPEQLATALAQLHRNTQFTYGFSYDNHIGSLDQSNKPHENFADFYINCRIEPQLALAKRTRSIVFPYSLKHFHRIVENTIPQEAPALIHGDLWSGNLIHSESGPVFIDPSVSYGHREMDLAMMRMFGGFEEAVFVSYEEQCKLEKGWRERADIFQLYYWLVHVNLFGGQYRHSAEKVFRKYLM